MKKDIIKFAKVADTNLEKIGLLWEEISQAYRNALRKGVDMKCDEMRNIKELLDESTGGISIKECSMNTSFLGVEIYEIRAKLEKDVMLEG
jgi:hypothetical protein